MYADWHTICSLLGMKEKQLQSKIIRKEHFDSEFAKLKVEGKKIMSTQPFCIVGEEFLEIRYINK